MSQNNGTVKHLLGTEANGYVVSFERDGLKRKASFAGMAMQVPITREAQDAFFASYETEIGGIKVRGALAAAARFAISTAETIRGAAREKLAGGASVDAVERWLRDTLDRYEGPTGERGGFRQREVKADKARMAELFETGGMEAVHAYLAEQGVKIG